MRNINADQPTYIGYAGEKNNTQVSFNLPSDWASATASNTVAVFTLPGTDVGIPYPVTIAGGYASWVVDEYAASRSGAGKVQLTHFDGTTNRKTQIYDTICKPSENEEVTPTPQTPWLDKMLALVAYFEGLPDKEANKYLGTNTDKNWLFKDGGGGGGSYSAGSGINISTDNKISTDDTYVAKKANLDTHTADTNVHTTSAEKGTWNGKQDKLTAGTNITISTDNVISASGGGATYTAGDGISISADNKISTDTATIPTKTELNSAVTTHNSASDAHSDIRADITTEATTRSAADTAHDAVLAGLQSGKVSKSTSNNIVYGTNSTGADATIQYGNSATVNTIVQREESGKITVGTPTDNAHATTKSYVDGKGENSLTSTDSTKFLTANNGKDLNDRLNNVEGRGRFLAVWNCANGKPETEPVTKPYTYKTGDYYIVGTVGTTNYRPDGASYTGAASTTQETGEIHVNDWYWYDGASWINIHTAHQIVTFSSISGSPSDNTNLAASLNAKQDKLTATGHVTIDASNNIKTDYTSETLVFTLADSTTRTITFATEA